MTNTLFADIMSSSCDQDGDKHEKDVSAGSGYLWFFHILLRLPTVKMYKITMSYFLFDTDETSSYNKHFVITDKSADFGLKKKSSYDRSMQSMTQ